MESKKCKVKIAGHLLLITLLSCAGCQSHSESEKLAKMKWQRASAQIKLTLAEQEYDSGRYEKATRIVKECISADVNMPQAHLLFGKLLLAQGRQAKAEGELILTVRLDEKLAQGWYFLGVAAQEGRQYQRAFDYYDKAMSLEPYNSEYILAVVDAYVAQNKCAEAVKLLEKKMAALPRDVSLKIATADLKLRLGHNDEAVRLYERARLLDIDNSDLAEALGYCYVVTGRWADAAAIFESLARQGPSERNNTYLKVLATCSMNANRYSAAVDCYNQLSVQERDNAEFWLRAGYAALGAGAANRAIAYGHRALALKPGWADAVALAGAGRYLSRDYAAAITNFETITADSKNAAFAWLMMGRCYEQLGQTERARWAYNRALKLKPHSSLVNLVARVRN